MTALPIDTVLPDLLAALQEHSRALLIAPPGAGKTTRVAPALLDQGWCNGQVLLLVPRRLAARAAAEFMAAERGEKPGEIIGYATRLDSKVGKSTRVIAMTHGVFLSRIQADPELTGVCAVLFDEVHERSLDNDLALALSLDAVSALREDLRLLAMSATLDVERFQRLLGDPPSITSDGRSYPLEIRHVGRDAAARIEPQMASAIRSALAEYDGSLLAFLPGVAEIERTADAINGLPSSVELHRLHGGIEPAAQRKALSAPPPGKRKLVLATSIAETSVTLEDVRIVVDSGLARRPRYDRGAGLTRLVTERASRAAVTQRAGRAHETELDSKVALWHLAAHDDRTHLGTRPQDDPVRQGQYRPLALGVRAATAAAPGPADRLERIGGYQAASADHMPDQGSGDRLLRETRAQLPRRARPAGPAEAPGLRRQFSLRFSHNEGNVHRPSYGEGCHSRT
jgi:ATP-dependent helicase HrpB